MRGEISLRMSQEEAKILLGSHPNVAEEAVDDAEGQACALTITEASTSNTALGQRQATTDV